jgi:hypothetical protein
MDNEIKTWLYDILQSINEIDSYYDSKPKKFDEFVADTIVFYPDSNRDLLGLSVVNQGCTLRACLPSGRD